MYCNVLYNILYNIIHTIIRSLLWNSHAPEIRPINLTYLLSFKLNSHFKSELSNFWFFEQPAQAHVQGAAASLHPGGRIPPRHEPFHRGGAVFEDSNRFKTFQKSTTLLPITEHLLKNKIINELIRHQSKSYSQCLITKHLRAFLFSSKAKCHLLISDVCFNFSTLFLKTFQLFFWNLRCTHASATSPRSRETAATTRRWVVCSLLWHKLFLVKTFMRPKAWVLCFIRLTKLFLGKSVKLFGQSFFLSRNVVSSLSWWPCSW